ncbi:MAG: TonB-dependent receptor [Sphingomonadales bacterium]
MTFVNQAKIDRAKRTALGHVCIWALLAAGAAGQAMAQESTQSYIEDIVVTAQKREENLQAVPLSVSAFSGRGLENRQAYDLRAISGQVPSLVVTNVVNVQTTAAVSIRGIGVQEADPFIDPAVGVVLDGVFQGTNTTALLDLFDIERIEILRGPQGTLFGTNTIGGVINVVTKQPTGEFGGTARVTAGNFGRLDVMGSIDFPIIEDVLAGKVTGMFKSFDGHFRNTVDGRRTGGHNIGTLRAYLKLTPSDNFDATLQFEYTRGRSDSPPVLNAATPDLPLFVPGESRDPANPDLTRAFAAQGPNFSDLNNYGGLLTMNAALGGVDLVSITAYREWDLEEFTDQDATSLDLFNTLRPSDHYQFSQELRGTFSPLENVEMIAGGFFMKQNYTLNQRQDLFAFAPGLQAFLDNDQDTTSASGFAQLYWNVTDRLKLQAGGRYTWEEKKMLVRNVTRIGSFVIADIFAPANGVPGEESWTTWGWRFGADYQVTDDMMVYAFTARGAHSGGFNGRITVPQDLGPFDPEFVDLYEIGAKTEWLDGRVRVNVAAFWNDYDDLQVDQLAQTGGGNITTQVLNAAGAETRGFELETTVVPVDNLTINGSLSFLDAEYTEFFLDLDGNPLNGQEDGSFLDLRNAPKWLISLGATYDMPTEAGTFSVHGNWRFSSRRETDTRNGVVGSIDPLHIVDANIKFTPPDERWAIRVWAKNLFDNDHVASGFFAANFNNFLLIGPPREVAVELTANF